MDWKGLKLPTNAHVKKPSQIPSLMHIKRKPLDPLHPHIREKEASLIRRKKEGDLAAATIITEASSAGDVGYQRRPKKTTWYSTDSILPVILLRYAAPFQTLGCRSVDIRYPIALIKMCQDWLRNSTSWKSFRFMINFRLVVDSRRARSLAKLASSSGLICTCTASRKHLVHWPARASLVYDAAAHVD